MISIQSTPSTPAENKGTNASQTTIEVYSTPIISIQSTPSTPEENNSTNASQTAIEVYSNPSPMI